MLETINPFVIPANSVKTEESDNNDLAMTDADVEQAGGVASQTCSRTRMVFTVNAIEPQKTKSPGLASLFKLLLYLLMFFCTILFLLQAHLSPWTICQI